MFKTTEMPDLLSRDANNIHVLDALQIGLPPSVVDVVNLLLAESRCIYELGSL